MSFESAVALAPIIAILCSLTWLTLPLTAVIAIRHRRRHGPARRFWFAYIVLGLWVATVVLAVMSFASGAWYGENGPSPQIADIEGAASFLVLLTLHVLLIRVAKRAADES